MSFLIIFIRFHAVAAIMALIVDDALPWSSCQWNWTTEDGYQYICSIIYSTISQYPLRLPFLRTRMPYSVRRTVIDLTVRSDLPISVAMYFWVAAGFCRMTRSTAISSKVQFLHFGGSESAGFALWTDSFALWKPLFALWKSASGFQSKCISRFLSGVASPSNMLRKKRSRYIVVSVTPSCRLL